MSEITDAFVTALRWIFTGNPLVLEITARTLVISCSATFFAALISIPLACLIHFNNFKGKGTLISILQTFYALPTVLVGLLVYLTFSNAGPLGVFGIVFTPQVMVIGQIVLISPLITGLTISALRGVGHEIKDTAVSLGASRFQMALTVLAEAKYATLTAVLIGFGRAISEVGIAIMVGGNIAGRTRVITTAMALETGQGEIALSMALGIILLLLALVVVIIPSRIQQMSGRMQQR